MNFVRRLLQRHDELKNRIHSFRIPLNPAGQKFMGFVYFCIPVILGYFIMEATNERAKENLKDLTSNLTPEQKTQQEWQQQQLKRLLDHYNPNKSEK